MRSYISSDVKKRRHFFRWETTWLIHKAIATNQRIKSPLRWMARLELSSIVRLNSPVRFNNRCFVSRNSRSVDRYTHLSRHIFRRLAVDGRLAGIAKATW